MSLSVNIEGLLDGAVVHLVGRIEPGNFQTLAAALARLLKEGKSKIVLDCNRLDYLSTAEVPLILQYEAEAQAQGGDIKWVGLSNELAMILHLLNGNHKLELFSAQEDALKAFRRGAVATRR